MQKYWEERKNLKYYKKVLELCKKYAFNAKSVLDIGSYDTLLLDEISWISNKTALDLYNIPLNKSATNLKIDFLNYDKKDFDLVLCLQTLEHLEKPKQFSNKLLETGKIIIISVPYKWKKGFCDTHKQDPIDEKKVLKWFKKEYLETHIIKEEDGVERFIAVFKGNK